MNLGIPISPQTFRPICKILFWSDQPNSNYRQLVRRNRIEGLVRKHRSQILLSKKSLSNFLYLLYIFFCLSFFFLILIFIILFCFVRLLVGSSYIFLLLQCTAGNWVAQTRCPLTQWLLSTRLLPELTCSPSGSTSPSTDRTRVVSTTLSWMAARLLSSEDSAMRASLLSPVSMLLRYLSLYFLFLSFFNFRA